MLLALELGLAAVKVGEEARVSLDTFSISGKARKIISDYRDSEDLINIGAYVKGSSASIDYALDKIEPLNAFLKQGIDENTPFDESFQELSRIIS